MFGVNCILSSLFVCLQMFSNNSSENSRNRLVVELSYQVVYSSTKFIKFLESNISVIVAEPAQLFDMFSLGPALL